MGCASSVDGGKGFNKVAPAPKSTKNNADKNSNHISEPDFLPGQSALSTYVFFIFKVVSLLSSCTLVFDFALLDALIYSPIIHVVKDCVHVW